MVDALDQRILAILLEDAHTPFRDIAKRAGTTVGTVHNRIKKMREAGVIRRFVADVDAQKLGFSICALVDIKLDGAHIEEVQKQLAAHPSVVAVYDVTGDVDCVVVGKFRDTADLDRFVKETLQQKHVRETHTRLALHVVKEAMTPHMGP